MVFLIAFHNKMMRYLTGNLLEAETDALVNTVNCVGVMGKGIALQFKQAFPENYAKYRLACEHHEVQPGRMFVYATGNLMGPQYLINFPTKRHWKEKSTMADIDNGLADLAKVIHDRHIMSVAVPPLGCGNGGLEWGEVRKLIEHKLRGLPGVEVLVYEPAGAPANR